MTGFFLSRGGYGRTCNCCALCCLIVLLVTKSFREKGKKEKRLKEMFILECASSFIFGCGWFFTTSPGDEREGDTKQLRISSKEEEIIWYINPLPTCNWLRIRRVVFFPFASLKLFSSAQVAHLDQGRLRYKVLNVLPHWMSFSCLSQSRKNYPIKEKKSWHQFHFRLQIFNRNPWPVQWWIQSSGFIEIFRFLPFAFCHLRNR
jgi:hypothetical protein